jgi:DUF2971 family protein
MAAVPPRAASCNPNWPPESLPTFLYRYDSAERAKAVLRENSLFYCSPKQFNDPFDGRLQPSFRASPDELRQIAKWLANRRAPNAPRSVRKAMARDAGRRLNTEFIERVFQKWQREVLDESGILCMTEKRDDILMWSHYARGHKGVCLEFECQFGGSVPLPVIYDEKIPPLNFAKAFGHTEARSNGEREALLEFGKLIFLTKAIDWKYEREWRYIDFALEGVRRFGLRGFPERFLKGVILGCQMDDSERLELLELARNRSAPFIVYQAIKRPRQFELEITPVDP